MLSSNPDNEPGYMPDYLPNRKVFAVKSHFRNYWPFYLVGIIILAIVVR